ncbi:PhlD [Streptomyces sp. W4I9-2]|uniref:PhlD n=1 Tax=Streptomyces sp. W4I9-2 TaxID=3042297 RepID=UPI00277D3370|nr:PhlD [Streptomyces sp. W4I9-2]MDQ0700897.1 putative naringenin-chalcone synthase [Streptomyces sp. W4I9-2]
MGGFRGVGMDVVVGRPVVVRAEHRVSTGELVEDLERRYGRGKLASWTRMLANTGVVERPWSAPLEENVAREGVGVRSRAAYEASRDRAVRAAQDALEQAELSPWEVDVLITTHTTSWTIPGLDVDLVGRLELRPDVERVGLATAACVGGGHGLVHAARALRDRPGGRALVVAAEDLSTLYRPGRELPTMQDVLYGGLFGDAAGAVVVSAVDEADAGDLVVEDVWELVLPESSDAYWGVVHEGGVTFDSGREATRAPGRVVPYLTGWLDERPVEWAAVHPGGPGIISGTLTGLGLDPEAAGRHARDSLAGGNLGGVALLDVLARTMAEGAVVGPGVAVAYGPGFTAAGLYLRVVRSGAAG